MPDEKRPTPKREGKLRVKAQGSYRSVVEPAWGVNFGPESDVDQVIPGSCGATLRQLALAGEIRADCLETVTTEE